MNTLKKIGCLVGLLMLCSGIYAQKDLHIEDLFRDYGKQEGSVLIELAKDVLGNRTKISRYKSLIIPSDTSIANIVMKSIQADLNGGKVLMESTKNGNIETGYYLLKKNDDSSTHEYILFTNKSSKITLIYIKGDFPPDRLERELEKLKDLFIKVNNKRIKLQ